MNLMKITLLYMQARHIRQVNTSIVSNCTPRKINSETFQTPDATLFQKYRPRCTVGGWLKNSRQRGGKKYSRQNFIFSIEANKLLKGNRGEGGKEGLLVNTKCTDVFVLAVKYRFAERVELRFSRVFGRENAAA